MIAEVNNRQDRQDKYDTLQKQQKNAKKTQMKEYKRLYDRPEVQINNEERNLKKNYFAPPLSMLIQGSSNSGKTYNLVQTIMDKDYDFFNWYPPQNIYIISPNAQYDKSMQKLIQFLKKDKDFDENEQILSSLKNMDQYLKNIYKFQQELREYQINRPIFILLDDIIGGKENIHSMKILQKLYTQGRHVGINVSILIQNSTSLSPVIRKNAMVIYIYRTFNNQDLRQLLDQIRGHLDLKTISNMYHQSTQKEHDFLHFDKRQKNGDIYCRGMDNILDLQDI